MTGREGCLNAIQSVLWTQQLHYNTAAQFIQPQSDKGIFWSIMLESRSHMSPNVCRTKTVLFLNRKYLLYNGEYMKHCPLCRSLLGQGLCFTGYKCLPIILILDQTTQPAHSQPLLFVHWVVSDMGAQHKLLHSSVLQSSGLCSRRDQQCINPLTFLFMSRLCQPRLRLNIEKENLMIDFDSSV